MAAVERRTPGQERQTPRRQGAAFVTLDQPSYWPFWISGWLWNIARWLGLFTASYLVFHRGGSTIAVQLVGAFYFLPMFVGGLAGGIIADRFDRRLVLIAQLWLLVALSILLSVDIVAGSSRPWHIYPAMLLLGTGSVADMTCRRALVLDLVGPPLLTNAFALESISMTGGTLIGNLGAGAIIDLAGTGAAFAAMGLLCALAAIWLARVRVAQKHLVSSGGESIFRQLAEALRYTVHNRALIGVLGITVIMNVFFYTYLPQVPAFAKQLSVSAFWAGGLGAAAGVGSLLGAILIVGGRVPLKRPAMYAAGTALSLASLAWFASSGSYALAFIALVVGGVGSAGFATMQSALVISIAPGALRGRAMGVLSMTIGTLPFAMFALGAIAERTGTRAAVRGSALIGLAVLGVAWFAGRSLRSTE